MSDVTMSVKIAALVVFVGTCPGICVRWGYTSRERSVGPRYVLHVWVIHPRARYSPTDMEFRGSQSAWHAIQVPRNITARDLDRGNLTALQNANPQFLVGRAIHKERRDFGAGMVQDLAWGSATSLRILIIEPRPAALKGSKPGDVPCWANATFYPIDHAPAHNSRSIGSSMTGRFDIRPNKVVAFGAGQRFEFQNQRQTGMQYRWKHVRREVVLLCITPKIEEEKGAQQ